MPRSYWKCASLALSIGLAAPITARAGGLRVPGLGGELSHPTTSNPTAIVQNPAALTLERGTRLYGDLVVGYHQASYERPASAIDHLRAAGERGAGTPEEAVAANSGRASVFTPFAAPTFLGIVGDTGEPNQAIAFAVHVPYAGAVKWAENDAFRGSQPYPGAVDGVQRWFGIESALTAVEGTAAFAQHFPALRLRVGVSASVLHMDVRTVTARTSGGTDDLVTRSGGLLEGRALLEVSGVSFVLGGGVLWEPADGVFLGLSYESKPGFDTMKLEGKYEAQLGPTTNVRGDVELEQALPDTVRAGVRARVSSKLELRLSGELQRWSVLDRRVVNRGCRITPTGATDDASGATGVMANLRRDWNDTLGARLGGSYFASPAIELFAGAGYDGNAVPDSTLDPGLSDAHKVTASLGLRHVLSSMPLALVATYTQVIFLPRTLAPRARDAAGEPVARDAPTRTPDPAGKYGRSLGVLSTAAERRF
jgi:long-chain fatty acid transport protein